ncbi:MAG: ABC transporter permease [Acidobacteriota bacterium]|nr:ABC transporter permease [Acidobacteriota bacterium]
MKEECRDVGAARFIESLLQDVRYGLRQLRRNPGFTAVAIIALALGIGANTVIFSAVNAELLHPFGFTQPSRIVEIWETAPKEHINHAAAAPANFFDWNRQSKTIGLLSATHDWNANLTGRGIAERVEGYQVTAEFFTLLGLAPRSGRFINATDFNPGREKVVVFSYGFWQQRLGADPGILNKTVQLNNEKFTVIGIMPKGFNFPLGAEAWVPIDLTGAAGADRADHYLAVFGRLKPGASIGQARAEMEGIAGGLGRAFPRTNAGHSVFIVGLVKQFTGDARPFLLLLMGAAGFVLLLACANVMNLQLARAAGREKEIAVRVALGGTRWRITRQLLAESLILAALGGLAGALLASWGLHLVLRTIPPLIVQQVAGLANLRVDSTVLAFTAAVALLSGILAGLTPAWRASRPALNSAMNAGAGRSTPARSRLRSILVVVEIALALVLLVGAGLMVNGFRHLMNEDLGFDRRNVLTFSIALPGSKYHGGAEVREFYSELLRKLDGLPGVESAGVITSLPGQDRWNQTQYRAENQPPATPGELRLTFWQSATPGFFAVLRVPLLQGRLLNSGDGPGAPPVVLISKSMAHLIYPGENPVGRKIRLGSEQDGEPWRTIVGEVGDVKQSPFDPKFYPTTYIPFSQMPGAGSSVVLRTSVDPIALTATVRREVASVDPDVPAADVRTLEQVVSGDMTGVASSARMMAAFGLIALILAWAGIFALMAYSVAQRTHEFGIRVALGAQPSDIVKSVLVRGVRLAAIGILIGVACSLALTRTMAGLLFGIIRTDPLTLAVIAILLALAALLACYIPARRAAKVDPMIALRHE